MRTEELLAYTGLTYRQLDYWTTKGLVDTDVPARGSGNYREWTDEQAEIVRIAAGLRNAGLDIQTATRIAKAMAVVGPSKPIRIGSTIDGRDAVWIAMRPAHEPPTL